MALVNYGSSDSEQEDELNVPEEAPNNRIDASDKNGIKKSVEEDEDLKTANHLPLPRPSTDSKVKSLISNLSTSKEKGKVKIFLPSFKRTAGEDEDNEEDENEREFKRFRYPSTKGSGLRGLLPPPKNQSKTSTKSTAFIPDVLKRRPAATTSNGPSTSRSSTSVRTNDDEDEAIDFFSFEQGAKSNSVSSDLKSNVQPVMSNKFETDLIRSRFSDSSIRSVGSNATPSTSQAASGFGQETEYQKERKLKYEIEMKFKDEVGDEVKIQEVNIANHLNHNLDYLKSLSEEKQPEVSGPLPSQMAKRKHQLTYLAYQAKQNELKLKDEWAQGRINRDQARSKYGF